MKETKTITLKNDAILVRMEPMLKERLLVFSQESGYSAAEVIRRCIEAHCPALRTRKSPNGGKRA